MILVSFSCCLVGVWGYSQSEEVSPEDFYTSGETSLTGNNCFRMTAPNPWSSGGVWHKVPIDLKASFTMDLEMMFGCDDIGGADGVVFIFTPYQGMVGHAGEGMGFAGLRPSLGIEIDTWENEHLFDPPEDHVAILRDGYVNHYYNLVGPNRIKNVEDCKLHKMLIHWSHEELELSVQIDGSTVISYTGDIVNEIFGGRSTVYWGVTAATGRYFNTHEICFERIDFTLPLDGFEFDRMTIDLLERGKVMTLEEMKFRSGRTALLKKSFPDLHRVINFMNENPHLDLAIEGHTDNVGSEDNNQRLSYDRANAVASYLTDHGISADKVHVKGYGETYPAADNNTPDGREQNRRVDIYFFKPRS